jgi:hypothetical protein
MAKATANIINDLHPRLKRQLDRQRHDFLWAKGVANCSCQDWSLRGCKTVENAKANHVLHRKMNS